MLAIVIPQPEEYKLADVPIPQAEAGQVVVKVKSTTICATDLEIFHGLFPGVSYQHIQGHEWGGEIVQIGAGVTGLELGDKIGVEVHVGCEVCPPCREGLYNLCENYGHLETGHAPIGFTVPGGLVEFVQCRRGLSTCCQKDSTATMALSLIRLALPCGHSNGQVVFGQARSSPSLGLAPLGFSLCKSHAGPEPGK